MITGTHTTGLQTAIEFYEIFHRLPTREEWVAWGYSYNFVEQIDRQFRFWQIKQRLKEGDSNGRN